MLTASHQMPSTADLRQTTTSGRTSCDPVRRHGVRSACHSERPTTGTPGQSGSLGSCMLERAQSAFTLVRALENNPELVVRGGVEPPTFRFSGCGITVLDRPRRSLCLLIGMKYT